jgi:hypothetical protein
LQDARRGRRADGRPEEFAAGGALGCARVPFPFKRGPATEHHSTGCHGHGPRTKACWSSATCPSLPATEEGVGRIPGLGMWGGQGCLPRTPPSTLAWAPVGCRKANLPSSSPSCRGTPGAWWSWDPMGALSAPPTPWGRVLGAINLGKQRRRRSFKGARPHLLPMTATTRLTHLASTANLLNLSQPQFSLAISR